MSWWAWLFGRKPQAFVDEVADYRFEKAFSRELIRVASLEVGKGEQRKNNAGPDVDKYRGKRGGNGAWCAAFCSWVIGESAARLGIPIPIEPTNGARKLFRRALRGDKPLQQPAKGMLVFWNRGVGGSWKGHIGIVVDTRPDGTFWSIEGNRGRYPAKVDIFRHQLGEDRLVGFARIKRAK